jgi:hypothetical protein
MTFKEKLKKLIIDNIIAMIISFPIMIGSVYLLSEKILPNLKTVWFLVFFISFAVFMYNLIVIVGVDNLGKRVHHDIEDLSDGKIDNKKFGKPIE